MLEKRRQESGAKKKKHLPSSSWSLSVSRGSLVTVTLWEWLNCRTVFAVWRASKARAACSRGTTAQRPACPALCLHSSYTVENTFQLVCWLPLPHIPNDWTPCPCEAKFCGLPPLLLFLPFVSQGLPAFCFHTVTIDNMQTSFYNRNEVFHVWSVG